MMFVNKKEVVTISHKELDIYLGRILKEFAKECVSERVYINTKRLSRFLKRRGYDATYQSIGKSLMKWNGFAGMKQYSETNGRINFCANKSDLTNTYTNQSPLFQNSSLL